MKRALKWIGGGLVLLIAALVLLGYVPDSDRATMRAKYAPPPSQFIDVGGGLTMHVRDQGKHDGPVLVLLHGSNASLHTWEPWVARLGAKYRLISFDQIGHGLTGPNPTDQYEAAAFTGTLDALMVKMGVSRFALAGNSMGGWVAWQYAVAHPDKVERLILIDAAGPPEDTSRKLPLGFRLLQTPVINRLVDYISPRNVFAQSLHQTVSNQAIVTDAVIERYRDLNRYPGNRRATRLRSEISHAHDDNASRVAAISVPTLILWGDEDKLIPVNGAGWFAARIKGSHEIVYPGIGHLPMEETPGRSAQDVDAFLSQPAS
jgi:pimeloyl-ACP methyl ester carboxylesterase